MSCQHNSLTGCSECWARRSEKENAVLRKRVAELEAAVATAVSQLDTMRGFGSNSLNALCDFLRNVDATKAGGAK